MERRTNARQPPVELANCIGLPEIDREHATLVRQLDQLKADKEAHPGSEAFSEVISRLGREMDAHFDSEEEILRSCGMPPELVLEHIQAHTEIIEQYARLNFDLMNGKHHSREEALGLLRRWIVDHVLTHDVKLSDYLAATPAGKTPGT